MICQQKCTRWLKKYYWKMILKITKYLIGQKRINYLNIILNWAYIYGKDIDGERAREIAVQLRSGALPAKLDLIQERNVDAVLGSESLTKSLTAGIVGFILVLIFMISYYKIPGLIASITLVIYLTFLVAIFKILPVTLTLSGAAALILSIGFAVDANILISERIKEELKSDIWITLTNKRFLHWNIKKNNLAKH